MKSWKLATTIALAAAFFLTTSSLYANNHRDKGRGTGPVVYVTSQDLFYDSIVLADLPYNGTDNFQLLEMTGPSGLQTDFGPTDIGYYGGRWWVDVNGDGLMDDGDHYFLCPLLGPGREAP